MGELRKMLDPGGGGGLELAVDVAHLEDSVPGLEAVRGFLESAQRKVDEAAHSVVGSGAVSVFGGPSVPNAPGLRARHEALVTSLRSGLSTAVTNSTSVIDGTRTITTNYRTVEERNRADVASILAGGTGSGTTGGATAPAR
jgi:hypothetical protein